MRSLFLLFLSVFAINPPAYAEGRPASIQTIEFAAFSTNGKQYALRVQDENLGLVFEVRDSKKNALIKAYPFQEEDEKRAWRKVRKAHEMGDDAVEDQENPKKGVVLMTQVKGPELLIKMMKGERILPYDAITLLATKKGVPAEAFVKQVVWDAKGKYALVIFHQEIKDLLHWEGDFAYAFKFRSYKVSFKKDTE